MTLRRQPVFWIVSLVFVVLFLWMVRGVLLPFVLGMALAYALDPIADRFEKLGLSRLWSTVSILLISVLLFGAAMLILIPLLYDQLMALVAFVPAFAARVQDLVDELSKSRVGEYLGMPNSRATIEQLAGQATSWLGTVITSIWAGGQAVINIGSLVIVTPVVAFYMLYDWDRMLDRVDSLLPRDHVETVRLLCRRIDRAMAGFIRGQGGLCLILGVYYAFALTMVKLNFALLIGAAAGIISFIPYVGSVTGFVLAVSVALFQFWPEWPWVLAVAGIFLFGQFVEGNILQPRLVGGSVGVHPVWLMFALFVAASLFGFVGMLLAVPVAAALGVLVRFAIERYEQSSIYRGAVEIDLSDPGPEV
ncbi:Predicted PurR-regulated permease PerM [Faunimonas pinastri]|uniref:Predicted PurR-regulated permease PerM n=1 Tax=Faunimonas pinastri TaxID=1855383 RepID=A0A1H9CAS6_9HYPH|nr:AI-2E family transporter [Faunimonas pinastri]SEP98254.1 Predicted PurR-regulated permease PerM [Faunimonas pinastri]